MTTGKSSLQESERNGHDHPADSSDSSAANAAKVLAGMTVGFAVVAGVVGPFLTPVLRRHILPYIPATPDQIQRACRLGRVALALRPPSSTSAQSSLIDIGSGDGRVVLTALKELPDVDMGHGVEVNQWLVYWSRVQAIRSGLARRTQFQAKDLWKVDFGPYDLVFVFGVPSLMDELESKLQAELKHGAAVVATRFPFPSWEPYRRDGLSWLYLATTPSKS